MNELTNLASLEKSKVDYSAQRWIGRGLRAGDSLPAEAFWTIRRRLMLDYCKWDPQIGDVSTLADFPLLIDAATWQELSRLAEAASRELMAAEAEIARRPELHRMLAVPGRIRRLLRNREKFAEPSAARSVSSFASPRVLRFDFHWTPEGWRISEVNSDVPGGYTESSSFTKLMAEQFAGTAPAGDPAAAWTAALAACAQPGSAVALVYAPGYLEDLQIVAYLADRLAEKGFRTYLATPRQIRFLDGRAFLESVSHRGPVDLPVDLVVRFFQAEWLASLPAKLREPWFVDESETGAVGRDRTETPIVNSSLAIFTESKRFPLIWDRLQTPLPTWRAILPETRDPRDVNWRREAGWVMKTAYCNTGDQVCFRELLPAAQWRKICRQIRWRPGQWIAQRRFSTTAIDSPAGKIFPCLGVYTVNGKAAGIYGRYSSNALVDFSAVDVAVLVEGSSDEPAMECVDDRAGN